MLSKLPTRQLTSAVLYITSSQFSKLPTRQLTIADLGTDFVKFSKLPTRQLTDESGRFYVSYFF